MISKTTLYYLAGLILILSSIFSCSKKDNRFAEPASYAKSPLFINNSILAGKIGVKYQGQPIGALIEKNRFDVLSGLAKFTFYNINTKAILLEKEFDLQPNTAVDTLYLFQPDSTIAPQLIKNTQINEPAALAGYMKVKIANLSKIALTDAAGIRYSKVDIIVKSTLTSIVTYAPIDTIMAIGSDLDTASYYLIKKAVRAGAIQTNYKFSFLDHTTKLPISNSVGTIFTTTSTLGAPITGKNVYTIYLTDRALTSSPSTFILKNNAYYDVISNKLFE